jgi:hypothetical protein
VDIFLILQLEWPMPLAVKGDTGGNPRAYAQGIFVKEYDGYTGRNPKTGEKVHENQTEEAIANFADFFKAGRPQGM